MRLVTVHDKHLSQVLLARNGLVNKVEFLGLITQKQ